LQKIIGRAACESGKVTIGQCTAQVIAIGGKSHPQKAADVGCGHLAMSPL